MEGRTFTAPSGNIGTIEAACFAEGTDNAGLVVNWSQHPTPADMQAFNDWFEGQFPDITMKGSRDMTGRSHDDIVRQSEEFARTGRLSLPEEN